ncbi:MAG TPA: heme exporter protein CcmB [Bryobacteraceae bacterium]|nr:heme exporter protein CcmB [Bryobacteraceae bacterium]
MKQGLMAALAIAGKDLRTEWRTRESLNSAVSFALVILVLFSFAFDLDREERLAISGGLLWLVYAFAGALIVNRSFAREVPNDCLEVLTSSVRGWSIFLGKSVACFVLLLLVELISLPIFGLFYNIRWTGSFFALALVMALSTWGITVVGTALSAITVNVRLRELMLPVLLYPLMIPLLIGAMEMTTGLLNGNAVLSDIRLLIVYDVMFTAISLYLIEFILVI